ncbi:B-cell linker protein isoform X3 [Carcharodon carcharias]|uniref:B-cell linker protein isoform X3 n=1 Tax=Carcharodon carcharias TaxID=13397 RepID=UPI001B7F222B|nr:B-cell linker protein isoform X3 [Carcharodon carcharias]
MMVGKEESEDQLSERDALRSDQRQGSLWCTMATRLPTREECESWKTWELAEFLRLNNLYEPASVVERQKISGSMFLNSLDILQNRFNVIDFPQIQKIVHDIQKNDGGFMSRFKKFQNEQVALMRKTGKSTWDRFTKPAPPSVPQRDYSEGAEGQEGGQWSDNEFDNSDYENPDGRSDGSDTYEYPRDDGDGDENYEPPPSENKNKKIVAQTYHISKGEYADNRPGNRPAVPNTKLPPMLPRPSPSPNQRKMLPHPQSAGKMGEKEDYEDDYIVPMEDNEPDDAYIEPMEKCAPPALLKPPVVNRAAKPSGLSTSPKAGHLHGPGQPASAPELNTESAQCHDVYEVPDTEEALPPVPRAKPQLPKPGFTGTGSPLLFPHSAPKATSTPEIPRNESPMNRKPSISQPEDDNDEYEVCDPEPSNSTSGLQDSAPVAFQEIPIPPQRDLKPTNRPLPKPRMGEPPKEQSLTEGEKPRIPDRPRLSNATAESPVLPAPRLGPKPAILKLPTTNHPSLAEIPNKPNGTWVRPCVPTRIPSPNSSLEQDPNVDGKAWFANHCDRKNAEEALNKFNKDGSFLVRKSSGQDSKQPYTLVVLYKRRVYNIPVRYIELTQEYALGKEKNGEESANSQISKFASNLKQL